MPRSEADPQPGAVPTVSGEKVQQVRRRLLTWFRANARDLPWRRTRDPYAVLVSEVMLQQTQVDRVIPFYLAFLDRFPTAEALAAAPPAEVIRQWAGLGYNRRAVNLQRTAAAVVARGGFPSDPATLRDLPGIGPYTAGAVSCFAFGQDVAFVDTNMRRVIQRVFFGAEGHAAAAPERQILETAAKLVPAGRGWAWNQALIEFGALQCTARKPACVVCPLQTQCAAFPAVLSPLPSKQVEPKQPSERFETSSRYYRGRILAAVRDTSPAGSGLSFEELGARLRPDYSAEHREWLVALVNGLAKDGLVAVAEESVPYEAQSVETLSEDCKEQPSTGQGRVRLP